VVSERLGLSGQPEAAEVAAIARDIALAEATGAHLHVAHVSTGRAVELISDAKQRGVRVTCEVTPSHLFLTEDAVYGNGAEPAYDTNARVNPPLRTERDRQALIDALNAGVIDAIATDHAPHAIEDKLCEFDVAAPGISCFETAAATIMEQVARGELLLDKVITALTQGPVQAFGLDRRIPGIGSLREGGPADITLLHSSLAWTVDTNRFVSKGKNSPLGGMQLRGAVAGVIAGGRLVMEVPAHV
jgi:dihydroorotase